MNNADIVIIGAGVIGLSTAYNLACRDGNKKIVVIEKESLPGMGSTAQCTGGIRHLWTSMINLQLTKISTPFFKTFEEQMGVPISYRQKGYLLCASSKVHQDSFNIIRDNLEREGLPVLTYTPEEIKEKYPFVNTEGLLEAIICPEDAKADPGNVVQGFEKQAVKLGVEVRLNETVEELLIKGGEIEGVITNKEKIQAPLVVNAAGPDFHRIASLAGCEVPSRPYKRQVYVCSAMKEIPQDTPLLVDMETGFYIHVEDSGTLLLGGTDKDASPGDTKDVDWSKLDNFIETAVHRSPCLENAELNRAYVGIRSLTPDYRGVLGESRKCPGFFLAGGFGGQGFMQSPAVGMIAAQLILDKKSELIDTDKLSPERFENKKSQGENVVF